MSAGARPGSRDAGSGVAAATSMSRVTGAPAAVRSTTAMGTVLSFATIVRTRSRRRVTTVLSFATTAPTDPQADRYSPGAMRSIAVLGLFLVACESGAKPHKAAQPQLSAVGDAGASDAGPDPSKLEGAALYATYCSQCHGPEAKGYKSDNAPSLVN